MIVEEVGKLLPAVFKRQVRRNEPMLVEILAPLWPRVVGKGIAEQARPTAFAAGTLTLVTACPSWAAQLRQMSEEVRAQVNSYLGGSIVKKLRVRLVLKMDATEAPAPQGTFMPEAATADLPVPEGAARLEPEMSEILERSFAKYFARQKTKVH
jgi:hypothetical protein